MILHYKPRVLSLGHVVKLPKTCASTENDHLKMYFPLNLIFQQSPCDCLLEGNKRHVQQKNKVEIVYYDKGYRHHTPNIMAVFFFVKAWEWISL